MPRIPEDAMQYYLRQLSEVSTKDYSLYFKQKILKWLLAEFC